MRPNGQGAADASTVDSVALVDARAADAVMTDAPAWNPTLCPAEYTLTIAGSPQSRYRLIDTTDTVTVQAADCADDHAEWTHLVVLGSVLEGTQIRAAIQTGNTFYVGAVQPRDQTAVTTGWVGFDGASLPAGAWQTGQPNDRDDVEDNEQQFAAADDSASGLLNDVSGGGTHRAVCECDGVPIPTAVASAFAASAP